MKLVVFILLFPVLLSAQHKGDNTIVIPGITMDQTLKVFRDKGYDIGNTKLNIIWTLPIKVVNGIYAYYEMTITDSTGYLQEIWGNNKIEYGLKGKSQLYLDVNVESFWEMDSLAKSFGRPVTYIKK
jgi:hypothetical protein